MDSKAAYVDGRILTLSCSQLLDDWPFAKQVDNTWMRVLVIE